MNAALGGIAFGRGGHVHLAPGDTLPNGRRVEGEVTTDCMMEMTLAGRRGHAIHGLSARRDAYLPLLIVVAVLVAASLGWRTPLRRVLIGVAAEAAVIVASLWLFVVWDFAIGLRVGGVYALSGSGLRVLDLSFRMLLLPPGNRFIVPLLIAAAIAGPRIARAAAPQEQDQADQPAQAAAPHG
jgi:hypothetical protein